MNTKRLTKESIEEIYPRTARERKKWSLKIASKKLGITPSYLCALELGHKSLTPEIKDKLHRTYKLTKHEVIVAPKIEDKLNFVEWLRAQIKWWDSRFVLPTVPAATSLVSDLFVPPLFVNEVGESEASQELLEEFFSGRCGEGLFISGGIGLGKSFFLRYLTLETEQIEESVSGDKGYVPILISLGEFIPISGSFVGSLVNYYKHLGFDGPAINLQEYFEKCLERGRLLLMFDGLDEQEDHLRRAGIVSFLERFFADQISNTSNRMIITGREETFDSYQPRLKGFSSRRISPWHAPQIFEGCDRWSWNNKVQSPQFIALLQSNDSLFRLARLPLLFHLLTTLYNSRGSIPFQDMAGLYDACCETLENSWSFSRMTFRSELSSSSYSDIPDGYSWLRWRHFLISLMRDALPELMKSEDLVVPTFTASEIKESWESFLTESGIIRDSLEFSKLEGLILSQQSIGPLYHRRDMDSSGRERVLYQFLDDSFAYFYLALALIDNAANLDKVIIKFLRQPNWATVISITIQELGRSERRSEQKLSQDLIDLLLNIDDEFELDKKHGVGKFGLLTAMDAVGSYNLEKYWNSVVEPFAKLHTQDEELFARQFWSLMGRHSTSPLLRSYYSKLYDNVVMAHNISNDTSGERLKHLSILILAGQKFEFAMEEYLAAFDEFITSGNERLTEGRVGIRRQLWRLPSIGRFFALDESLTSSLGHPKIFDALQSKIVAVVNYLCEVLTRELQSNRYVDYQFWHIFTTTMRCQARLHYVKGLRTTVKILIEFICNNLAQLMNGYPYRIQVLQCLKVLSFYATRSSDRIVINLRSKLLSLKDQLEDFERKEIENIVKTIDLSMHGPIDQNRAKYYYESMGEISDQVINSWVEECERSSTTLNNNIIAYGQAVCGLGYFHTILSQSKNITIRNRAIKALLKCRKIEINIGSGQEREEDRCYTDTFTDYCFPMYDHLYNTLVEIAKDLPLTRLSSTK